MSNNTLSRSGHTTRRAAGHRTRRQALLAAATSVGLLGAALLGCPPTAYAEIINLNNGLRVDTGTEDAAGNRLITVTVTDPTALDDTHINVRSPGRDQLERELNNGVATFIVGRERTEVSVQTCSFETFDSICSPFATFYPYKVAAPPAPPPVAAPPAPPPIKDTDGDTIPDEAEVSRFKTDPLKADTDGDGVNDRQDGDPLNAPTPKKVAPTNAVTVNVQRAGLQVRVTVANTSALAAQCTYNANEVNGLGPPVSRDFSLGPNGSTTLTFPAPLIGQRYRVVVACRADFEGTNVEIGRVEKDV